MFSLQRISRFWLTKAAAVVLAGVLLGGCATTGGFAPGVGTKYQYNLTMVAPSQTTDLTHRDERVLIQFKPDEAAMKFQIQNISDQEMTVVWDRASIGVEGRFYPVRHASTLYTDSASSMSIILPPLGYLRDLLIPAENIRFDGEKWVEADLLPTVDGNDAALRSMIRGSVGKQISVILPLRFGDTEAIYEFAFKVSSVRPIAWRDYQPVTRVPAPPVVHRSSGPLDQVTVAVIALGVLGFVAFIVSIAKDTPTE
jgi:hypothetical protein